MSNPYDAVPWVGQPIDGTAPEQLAVASWLQGGPVPDVYGCRVLELGCGDGGNLLPMAWHRRECRFVGVDSSESAVARARAGIDDLGLRNVEIRCADLWDVEPGGEPYDVVIAHGLLSWIPPHARPALLALCRGVLAPRGLLVASFNVAAGWIGRGLVREALLGATAGLPIAGRVERARDLAARFAALLPGDPPYAALLRAEFERVGTTSDAYVAHETLAPDNHPMAWGALRELAAQHDLRAIGDARFHRAEAAAARWWAERLGAGASDDLVDLLGGRQFRYALLARRDAPASDPSSCIHSSTVAAGLTREDGLVARFFGDDGAGVEVADPRLAWILGELAAAWPRGRSLVDLVADGQRALPDAPWDDADLAANLTDMARVGFVDLRMREGPTHVPRQAVPVALTRWEAARNGPITTPFHVPIPLDDADRQALLDGSTLPGHLSALLARWGLLTN